MVAKVMIVDDDESFSSVVKRTLKSENIDAVVASTPMEALRVYRQHRMDFDVLLIDFKFRGLQVTGSDFAQQIKAENPHQAVVFMTGFDGGMDMLISMLEAGNSRSFIKKGGDKTSILRVIKSTLKELGHNLVEEPPDTIEDQERRALEISKMGLRGQSKSLYEIVRSVVHLRRFRSRFLIVGDSGSGKERIARAFEIPGKPFIAVDCSKYSVGQEHFLESELYGYKKGAFTGADREQAGLFESANGGVIFFDELHCLSVQAQSKLLRTIQEMRTRRLGDTSGHETRLDLTFVSAAQPVIYEMIKQGEFKEDLYFRLAKSVTPIPALKDRKDDIRPLARYFFEKLAATHKVDCAPHPQLLKELEAYSWPGNVRELENFVDNAVMNTHAPLIGPEVFRSYLLKASGSGVIQEKSPLIDLNSVVEERERSEIVGALLKTSTIGEAAHRLQIPRTTLNDRMKRLGINAHHYLMRRE